MGGLGGAKSEESSNPTSPAEQQDSSQSNPNPSSGNFLGKAINFGKNLLGGKGSKIIDMGKNLIGGLFNRGKKKSENKNEDESSEENSEQANDDDIEENWGRKPLG